MLAGSAIYQCRNGHEIKKPCEEDQAGLDSVGVRAIPESRHQDHAAHDDEDWNRWWLPGRERPPQHDGERECDVESKESASSRVEVCSPIGDRIRRRRDESGCLQVEHDWSCKLSQKEEEVPIGISRTPRHPPELEVIQELDRDP